MAVDCHVHTLVSPDSDADLGAYCARAESIGLELLVVTDHIDFDPRDPASHSASFRRRLDQLEGVRQRYGSRVGLAIGVEVSYESRFEERIRQYLRASDYDFVLGSVHDGFGTPFHPDRIRSTATRSGPVGVLEAVVAESTAAVRSGLFDAIAHLDRARSWTRRVGAEVRPDELVEIFEPCLKEMVDTGVALEINTGEKPREPSPTYPLFELVDAFRVAGGTYLTIGSDSHHVANLGYDAERLSGLGLESFEPTPKIRALLGGTRDSGLRPSGRTRPESRTPHRTT